jgi:hypothetical protein
MTQEVDRMMDQSLAVQTAAASFEEAVKKLRNASDAPVNGGVGAIRLDRGSVRARHTGSSQCQEDLHEYVVFQQSRVDGC